MIVGVCRCRCHQNVKSGGGHLFSFECVVVALAGMLVWWRSSVVFNRVAVVCDCWCVSLSLSSAC